MGRWLKKCMTTLALLGILAVVAFLFLRNRYRDVIEELAHTQVMNTTSDLTNDAIAKQIADGIMLEDGEIHADAIEYASETDRKQVGIEIHSGRNRIVRRIFEHLGYKVIRLDRVYFAGLTKKNVRRGDWRFLTEQEVSMLWMGAFE